MPMYSALLPSDAPMSRVQEVPVAESVPVIVSRELLGEAESEALDAIWHNFGTYRPSSAQRPNEMGSRRKRAPKPSPVVPDSVFRSTLPGRFDAARNFRLTGGRFGRLHESPEVLSRRTDYFRETYASGSSTNPSDIGFLLRHEALAEQARRLHDATIVVPTTIYANVLVPGQELGLHT